MSNLYRERPFAISAIAVLSLIVGFVIAVAGVLLVGGFVNVTQLTGSQLGNIQPLVGILLIVVGALMILAGAGLFLLVSFAWILYVLVSGLMLFVFLGLGLLVSGETLIIALLVTIVSIVLGYFLGQKEFFEEFPKEGDIPPPR
ncbi:MAG: hypothetical protein ACFFCZ_30590 [Promethearchaeota archaeon]